LGLRKYQVKHVLKAHFGIQPLHYLLINPKSPCSIANQNNTTCNITSGRILTSCSIKDTTHIKNYHLHPEPN